MHLPTWQDVFDTEEILNEAQCIVNESKEAYDLELRFEVNKLQDHEFGK